MTNSWSSLRNTARKDADEHWRLTSLLWQPAIPFDPKKGKSWDKRKGSKDGDSSDDDNDTVTLQAKINAEGELTENNTVSHKVPKFKTGTPEEYCTWRNTVEEFFAQRGCAEDPKEQLGIYRSLFQGPTLVDFKNAYKIQRR
ncbi:MAG: hypothetical protein ACRCZI_00395 [Cetobacterium sp.]